jgi:hypothetical protein
MALMETRFNEKICATCEYWENERTLHFVNNMLYAILHAVKQGCCQAKGSILINGFVSGTNCAAYKRWHKLPDVKN